MYTVYDSHSFWFNSKRIDMLVERCNFFVIQNSDDSNILFRSGSIKIHTTAFFLPFLPQSPTHLFFSRYVCDTKANEICLNGRLTSFCVMLYTDLSTTVTRYWSLIWFSLVTALVKNGKYKQAQYNARWILRRSNSYRKELLVYGDYFMQRWI